MQNHKAHILLKEKLAEQGFSKIESPKFDDSSYFMKQEGDLKIYLWSPEMVSPKKFQGIGLWIALDSVELLISKIQKKYDKNIESSYFKTVSFNKLYSDLPDEYRNIVNNVILVDDEIIKSVIDYMMHFIDTVYKPLWEKYSNLQVINDELIEKIPQMGLANYISGQMHLKKMIIMKYCNNPKYEEYKQWLKSVMIDNQDFTIDYLIFTDLYNFLEGRLVLDENYMNAKLENENIIEILKPESNTIQVIQEIPVLPQNLFVEQAFEHYEKEFNTLGIHFDKKFTLNDYRNDANWQSWEMEETDKIDWRYFLLLFSGTEVFETATNSYQPVSPNVYYFNAEWDGFVNYGKIIQRLNLLTNNELAFTNIVCEQEGICIFEYKGKPYEWRFEINSDWTDPEIFNLFTELVFYDVKKTFYIMPEGQGGIIVYFSKEERQNFETYFNTTIERL
jgi:hypothetical protein